MLKKLGNKNKNFRRISTFNGNNIAANDNNGIVNGAHSFVKKLVLTLMAERSTIVMRQIIV